MPIGATRRSSCKAVLAGGPLGVERMRSRLFLGRRLPAKSTPSAQDRLVRLPARSQAGLNESKASKLNLSAWRRAMRDRRNSEPIGLYGQQPGGL